LTKLSHLALERHIGRYDVTIYADDVTMYPDYVIYGAGVVVEVLVVCLTHVFVVESITQPARQTHPPPEALNTVWDPLGHVHSSPSRSAVDPWGQV